MDSQEMQDTTPNAINIDDLDSANDDLATTALMSNLSLNDSPDGDGFATRVLHHGQEPELWDSKAVTMPIISSTVFRQSLEPGVTQEYTYSRSSNPTRVALEKSVAASERANYACCFASGIAALDNCTRLIKAGDHIIAQEDGYGGSFRYYKTIAPTMGCEVSFVNASVTENIVKAFRPNTALIWLETPTNPLMNMVDLREVNDAVNEATQKGLWSKPPIVAVDNSFMTSYFQRPLELGCTVTMYSLSKFMNGHCDALMGALVTNDADIYVRLKQLQSSIGSVPSAMDCFLVNRGMKTLHLRMDRHMTNSLEVARFLLQHPLVDRVLHPGLPSHPQYELGKRQMKGYSGMLSFSIKGTFEESRKFVKALKFIPLTFSLGGYKTLISLPARMSQKSMPPEHREKLGMTDTLFRLSVGVENVKDIIGDLENGLNAIVK